MIQVRYDVSKFLHLQMLLTPRELEKLFADLGFFEIYDNSCVQTEKKALPQEEFLKIYRTYFDSLFTKEKVSIGGYAVTCDPNAVKGINVADGRVLIKPALPVIQLKEHSFIYGQDGAFHSNVHGEDVIRWGIQWSFPQIFVDPETKMVHHVLKEEKFLNAELFRKAMKWMRYNTKPTPFNIEGRIKRATFRIGLLCVDQVKDMHDTSGLTLWRKG